MHLFSACLVPKALKTISQQHRDITRIAVNVAYPVAPFPTGSRPPWLVLLVHREQGTISVAMKMSLSSWITIQNDFPWTLTHRLFPRKSYVTSWSHTVMPCFSKTISFPWMVQLFFLYPRIPIFPLSTDRSVQKTKHSSVLRNHFLVMAEWPQEDAEW